MRDSSRAEVLAINGSSKLLHSKDVHGQVLVEGNSKNAIAWVSRAREPRREPWRLIYALREIKQKIARDNSLYVGW